MTLSPADIGAMAGALPVSSLATGEEGTAYHIAHYYPERFSQHLAQRIEQAKASQTKGALIVLTVSNMAMIVGGYGHGIAEQVVADIAARLKLSLPPGAVCERIGRDQFALILLPCSEPEAKNYIRMISQDIRQHAGRTIQSGLHATISAVSVEFADPNSTVQDVLDAAYVAMKRTPDYAITHSVDTIREEAKLTRQQMGLANYLRSALDQHKLRLAYQPIVESVSGEVCHYEALLRVVGDDGKISSAGALVPIAERMDLIDIIDHEVLAMVCRELRTYPDVTLALNVSNLTTENSEWIKALEAEVGANPEIGPRLIVEITETAAQRDLRRTAYFVAGVQALGCQVALDDFGSGYTSFRQLKALSVDMIKIDGSFVKDLVDNADNRFFVKTLLDFTQGFGLKSVAEFVENGETAKMLMDLGVDMMQGYYFAKPENHRTWMNGGEYKRS